VAHGLHKSDQQEVDMTITIKIDTKNAAFEEDREAEIERILADIGRRAEMTGPVYDFNGNKVGSVKVVGR
jgi:hypothetical protein